MKLVILDGNSLNPGDLSYDCLKQFGEVTLYQQTATAAETIDRIGDSEIVLVNKVPITQEILDACPNIRLICVTATGYNVVDCAACARRGIPVTNVPSYSTEAVAQFTIALMLELCHQIGLHSQSVHRGEWIGRDNFCYWLTPQMELGGKTLGILGFGRIGQTVGRLAKAFGMEVIAYNRSQCDAGRQIGRYVSLDELLERSDILSLHCPLFPETAQIINAAALEKMKDGAFLINTSRGGLLNEADVAQALKDGKLRGAAVDVVSREPMEADNPLLGAPNCIITPHMAWAPVESRQRLLDCVVDNIRAFLAGESRNVVNG
ncbi:MAG TPA: D-2-hydroxyacid dehydrogenase [Candidatus Butyricicoccus stercorigallinarum]|nr:D-2-hydroxyacid dehydrogenase [Candidatus Butyricicoccus stercorigallinarum]